MTISNEAMTLIGLVVTCAVVMSGALLWIGKYQGKVDQNTDDIKDEKEAREKGDSVLAEQIKEDRISSYKRDSDITKEIRRVAEETKRDMERFDRRLDEVEKQPQRTIPIGRKEA